MRKAIIASLILVLCFAILFTGCIDDTTKIEGTIHNTIDENVVCYLEKTTSGKLTSYQVRANSTIIRMLEIGEYKIWADYISSGERIDETEMTLRPNDTSFTISIRDYQVMAYPL